MKMIDNRSGFEVLDRRECLRLLAGEDVGRVGVVEAGSPLVLPVNFGMDGDIIVFRTGPGTKLSEARGHPACFEVDHFDPEVGDYAPATAEVAARFPLPGSRSNRQGQKKTSGSRAAARTRSRTRTASAILALAALLLASCSKPDAEPPSTPDVRIESKGDTTSAVRAILVGDVLILEGARVKEGGLLNSAVAWSNVAKVTADGVVWRGYRVTVVDGAPHMERVE